MRRAVIFDLFGTLVSSLSRTQLREVLTRMAESLGVEGDSFADTWVRTFNERAVAVGSTVDELIQQACGTSQGAADKCCAASRMWLQFVRERLVPRPTVPGVLSSLKESGYRLGVISDCSAEVPQLWGETAVSKWIDAAVFSCQVGHKKPARRVFEMACEALEVAPADCLYVADGSCGELDAAREFGMSALLLRWHDEDPSDAFRVSADTWDGPAISRLEDVDRWLPSDKEPDKIPSHAQESGRTAPPTVGESSGDRPRAVRTLRTSAGAEYELPMFLPVYQQNVSPVPFETWTSEYGVEGCIVNAFFLYKAREVRSRFQQGLTLPEYLRFSGLVMTDSGAFQGFVRKLFLSNRDIVAFQEMIGSHIISPLDLVTPPSDSRSVALRKLEVTTKRVREAQRIVSRGILASVQQGGRFLDLRRRSTEELLECGVRYLAIGSLVPFFTRNHDLAFAGQVLRDARAMVGWDVPIHIFGSGDPVEIPFLTRLGADLFDSSSYVHYARRGCYMTPFGALADMSRLLGGEYACPCHVCRSAEHLAAVVADLRLLTAHNLWTICHTLRRVRALLAAGELDGYLEEVLQRHTEWFPESKLRDSWLTLHDRP